MPTIRLTGVNKMLLCAPVKVEDNVLGIEIAWEDGSRAGIEFTENQDDNYAQLDAQHVDEHGLTRTMPTWTVWDGDEEDRDA